MQDRDGFGFHHEIPFLVSDFVLVWETIPWELSWEQDSCENRDLQERSAAIHRTWRKEFLDKLHSAGIHIEKEPGDLTPDFHPPVVNTAFTCGLWGPGEDMPCHGGLSQEGSQGLHGCNVVVPISWVSSARLIHSSDQHGVTPVPLTGPCTGASSLISFLPTAYDASGEEGGALFAAECTLEPALLLCPGAPAPGALQGRGCAAQACRGRGTVPQCSWASHSA